MNTRGELKILFTGTVGAGKTTAIAAVSDIPPMSTDVRNNDPTVAKALTTVGMDYGELALGDGEVLRLYGTPGQERYSFMWSILVNGALGLVILIDNSRPEPLADLDLYLNGFSKFIAESPCVVGICRMETHPSPDVDAFAQRLEAADARCPVIAVDVRDRDQVVAMLDLLLVQMESQE